MSAIQQMLAALGGGGANTDPYWSNVVLLLPLTSNFTDVSPTPKTVTQVGNVVISSSQSPFGIGSAAFDGSGDCIKINSHTDFDFGSGEFCIELFGRFAVSGASDWVGVRRDTTSPFAPWGILLNGSKVRTVYASGTSSYEHDKTGTTNLPNNVWHHIGIQRDNVSGVVCGLANGNFEGVTSISSTMRTLNEAVAFGAGAANGAAPSWNGFQGCIRVTRRRRYDYAAGSYVVPSGLFPTS